MNNIDVEIFGKTYTIKGDADPDYVRQVARFVDDRMRMAARKNPSSASGVQKLAVLTALNIADEYFKLRSRQEKVESMVQEKTDDLFDILREDG